MTTDITEPQKIIRGSDKKLHANKLDNLKEMKKFLETHNLLKLNHDKIENVKHKLVGKRLTSNQVSQQNKVQDKIASLWILQNTEEELISIFLNSPQKNRREGNF